MASGKRSRVRLSLRVEFDNFAAKAAFTSWFEYICSLLTFHYLGDNQAINTDCKLALSTIPIQANLTQLLFSPVASYTNCCITQKC